MIASVKELEKAALNIRKDLLKLCMSQAIHIGGDLSVTDIMTVLWQYQMHYDPQNIYDEYRDRFILSKGHASAVVNFNQAAIGCFDKQKIFREYAADEGSFSMHSCNLKNPFIEVSTGSLGHGMPVACGIAQALKLKGNQKSRVYTVMGDGEQAEGSIWEAAMNAVHYKLNNLVAIIDSNGLEADGTVKQITALNDIADKYKSFGWHVIELDGNNIEQIKCSFDTLSQCKLVVPTILVCKTVKGKGVSFMENQVKWHAGKISEDQYALAIRELDDAFYLKWREK